MIQLVMGGSGSGKSEYAEQMVKNSAYPNRFYLATMQVFGEEGKQKVERHRKLREGKGFVTLEKTRNLDEITLPKTEGKRVVLLECLSNLTANEMFLEEQQLPCDEVVEKILFQIDRLRQQTDRLVVVTNNVFEDGIRYDAATMEYIRALGKLNQELAKQAQEVWEVVLGIPLCIKPI